jgi:capsular polysaccharide transport system permease protein
MTTRPKADRFRIRRTDFPAPAAEDDGDSMPFASGQEDGFGSEAFATARGPAPAAAAPAAATLSPMPATGEEIDAIRREGLTGRQLRLARRMAQMHNLPATSDFDAVRLLRKSGIDPFQKGTMLELVSPDGEPMEASESRALATVPQPEGDRLPVAARTAKLPSPEVRADTNHAADIQKIQQDLARRRRRKSALLAARLFFFVGLPTFLCGWYYYLVATPLFETKSEFVIQQSANPTGAGAGGLGGLLQGSPFATQQDSIAVQGYLQSREAMQRLDADHGFRAHFSADTIDPIQRLAPDASEETAYKTYSRNIKISYDPTEGIVKLAVAATDPQTSAEFARALIGYAEGQVDQLTQRLREDQMQGARDAYEEAEGDFLAAQQRVVQLQEQFKVLSSEVEVQLLSAQITQLETQLTTEKLSLAQMEANSNPNQARMEPVKRRIAALEAEIASARAKLTEDGEGGQSLAKVQGELLVAQADVQTRQMLLAQSLSAMEAARIEANRQVRYLSLSVSPVPPDEATYPRAFENTLVAGLIFAGIYLLISMTAAILREQVSA